MRCPACGREQPVSTLRCECGHEFVFLSESAPGAAAAADDRSRQLAFHGEGGALFGIWIVNLLLTILTLGVYYFWGKVRIRHYLLGHAEFEQDRFAYHATGKELFLGYVKVALFFGLLYGVQLAVELLWKNPIAIAALGIFLPLLFSLLVFPLAIVGSRRFRMSRTSWRGIRFSFRGRARDFLKIYVPGLVLSIVTLGLYYPFFQNNIRRFLVSRSYFGTTPFAYDGRGRDLFRLYVPLILISVLIFLLPFLLVLGSLFLPSFQRIDLLKLFLIVIVGGIVSLGAYWIWFSAQRQRYYWAHTSFTTTRFRSTVTAGRLVRLFSGDLVRLIFTLGLGWPWVLVRHAHFTFANLFIEGPLNLETIQQEAQAASAAGESLADILGPLDFELGL